MNKDNWRTPPELVNDALKLLNIYEFDVDVCCASWDVKIHKAKSCILEKEDALQLADGWFDRGSYSFCNPPFSLKWKFVEHAINQVNVFKKIC